MGGGSSAPDERYLREALRCARIALRHDEVPVGAVVVLDGAIVGRGWNRPIGRVDPTAHAEIVAMRRAARKVGNYRLTGGILYVTLEPCLMCVGAMVQARVKRVVYGATDPRRGALSAPGSLDGLRGCNHRFEVTGGVLAREAAELLRGFFAVRRASRAT